LPFNLSTRTKKSIVQILPLEKKEEEQKKGRRGAREEALVWLPGKKREK